MICLLYLQKQDGKRYLHFSSTEELEKLGQTVNVKHKYNHLDWVHKGITPHHVVFQQLLASSANTGRRTAPRGHVL